MDAQAEGLMMLTNNSDVAAALNSSDMVREYSVRFFSRTFTDDTLRQLRNGVRVKMKTVKLWVEVQNKQTTNTWVHVKTTNNSVADIKNAFRRLSLRVNRIKRTKYGPFSLTQVKGPGLVKKATMEGEVKKEIARRLKEKTNSSLKRLDDLRVEEIREEIVEKQRGKLDNKTTEIQKI